MTNSNKKKSEQLGMPHGTASGRLRKKILYDLLVRLKENFCYQCENEIQSETELSIEHKTPWLDNSPELFWDLNNIAFSHLSCNAGAARNPRKGITLHPSQNAYRNGCRCNECKVIQKDKRKDQRVRGINT